MECDRMKLTVNEVIAAVHKKSEGRTRYEGQGPYWDELLVAEIESLRSDVIAFCAPWAATYARDCGLPEGHLHPAHYDILARAGARMDAFTRGEQP